MVKLVTICSMLCVGFMSACTSVGTAPLSVEAEQQETVDQSLILARSLRDSGHFEAAAGVYETANQKNLLSPEQALEYASVAALVRSPRETLQLYQQVEQRLSRESRISPSEQYSLCLGMARARLALNQLAAAQSRFECALNAYPTSISALNGMGVLHSIQDDAASAERYFNQALAVEPNHSLVTNNLALLYLGEGQAEKSIRLLQTVQTEGNSSQVLNLALAYLLNNQSDQAQLLLNNNFQASQVDPILERLQHVIDQVEMGQTIQLALLSLSETPMMLTGKN